MWVKGVLIARTCFPDGMGKSSLFAFIAYILKKINKYINNNNNNNNNNNGALHFINLSHFHMIKRIHFYVRSFCEADLRPCFCM